MRAKKLKLVNTQASLDFKDFIDKKNQFQTEELTFSGADYSNI